MNRAGGHVPEEHDDGGIDWLITLLVGSLYATLAGLIALFAHGYI